MKSSVRHPVRRSRVPCAALVLAVASSASDVMAEGDSADGAPPLPWATVSSSPVPVDDASLDDLERQALHRCGPGDAGLVATARWIVAQKLRAPMPELDAIASAQRASGEPHPWSRAWAETARVLSPTGALRGLDEWLGQRSRNALRRCGAATGAGPGGTRTLVVVAVDALADLTPLPTRVRVGQWLTVNGRLRTHAGGAKVIVLGPSGAPQPLPTSFDGAVLRASFAPDRAGEFAIQVMADLPTGPRPVLEVSLFADVDPPRRRSDAAAPGEDRAASLSDDAAIAEMVGAARSSAALPSVVRDIRLDAVARDHARRMAEGQELAHDVGDGDPIDRMRGAGLEAHDAGENVAHARNVVLAHRAMWASPSHRANTLRREFDRAGFAVARDEHGDAWVVELFAGGLR